MRRLNWGCGPDLHVGWTNSDVKWHATGAAEQHHVGDIRLGLPYPAEYFDYVVSHHVLHEVAWPDLVPALVELRRVLKIGGWLRLSVPDVEGAVHAWRANDAGWFPIADRHETSVDGKFCMYVTQAGATRSVFTKAWLMELLQRAAFVRIDLARIFETRSGIADLTALDTRGSESLYVDARR